MKVYWYILLVYMAYSSEEIEWEKKNFIFLKKSLRLLTVSYKLEYL